MKNIALSPTWCCYVLSSRGHGFSLQKSNTHIACDHIHECKELLLSSWLLLRTLQGVCVGMTKACNSCQQHVLLDMLSPVCVTMYAYFVQQKSACMMISECLASSARNRRARARLNNPFRAAHSDNLSALAPGAGGRGVPWLSMSWRGHVYGVVVDLSRIGGGELKQSELGVPPLCLGKGPRREHC